MRALQTREFINDLTDQIGRPIQKKAATNLFINNLVLTEAVNYLEQNRTFKRDDIVKMLRSLLHNEIYKFENREIVTGALQQFTRSKIDFTGCLKNCINKEYFCFDEEMDIQTQPSSGVAAI